MKMQGNHISSFLPDNLGEKPDKVYKFRTWSNSFHRKIITQGEVWFSHPFDLNDPFELRPPNKVIINKLTSKEASEHLWRCLQIALPSISDSERKIIFRRKIEEIKNDPIDYFLQGITVTERNKTDYDQFGVLSLSINPCEMLLWSYYGDSHKGFCVGFNTRQFADEMSCLDGRVIYSDEPIDFDPMREQSGEEIANGFFKKSLKWTNEEEYRFLTGQIDSESARAKTFSANSVEEIILGMNISAADEEDIIKNVMLSFDKDVPIYKIGKRNGSYELGRNLLKR